MHLWNFWVSQWISKDSVNRCFRDMVVYKACIKNFPLVQGLRLRLPMQGLDSIPGQEAKIPHALRPEN